MIKFEHQWGGEDNWYTKGKRWANKQKFPINHLALGALEWLREKWIDGRVSLEMDSVDEQANEIKEEWEKNDRPQPIVEEGVSGVEGLPSLRISAPFVDRGTKESSASVGTPSDEKGLYPDPWDYSGDWNDALIGFDHEFRKLSRDVEKR